jgi:hypothetical protein
VLGATGCSDDDSSATTGASSDTTDGPSDGTAATTATSTGSGDSGGDTSASATSTGSGTDGTSTGGEVMLCNGWEEGADAPWLELYGSNPTPMQSGETFAISCGGQGSYMFALYPHMGGWSPASGSVTFVVDVQVDGFTGPTGQFFLAPQYPYDIECSSGGDTFDDGLGGFSHACIAVLPPDDYLDDLSVLDGATATIHVEMLDDGGQSLVAIDLTDITLSAPVRQVSEPCFF